MAGDVLSAKADYYYPGPVTNNNNSQITDIVTGLIQAITGSPAVNPIGHGNTANISSDLNGSVPFASLADPDKNATDNIPRAYLNIMFFNERFEFVEEGSMALRVSQPGDEAAPLVLSNIKAPKNGYVYIYLSNENDDAVYFDNFTVSFTRGRIIEENHYYAFGLRIAGISSRKFDGGMEGSLKNEFLYQGDFADLDEDIGWYDFELRNYDAQIGRFIQSDPFGQFASPYTGMGNNPVNFIDPSGGIGIPCPGTSQLAIFFMKAGEVIGNGLNAISHISSMVSIGVHTIQAGTEIYNNSIQFKIINRQLTSNVTLQAGSEGDGKNSSYWILYNGTEVNVYDGEFGNTDNLIESFKGTSGIYTTSDPEGTKIFNDYRNAKYQFTEDEVNEGGVKQKLFVGPLPEGNYSINLSLDPDRQAKLASNGETIPGKGMEKITYFKNGLEYVRYPGWGSRRARLEAGPDTKLGGRDGNFYFHNSHKGYTHGCVETEPELFTFLISIRQTQPSIRVKIKYKSKNVSTNGHTKY